MGESTIHVFDVTRDVDAVWIRGEAERFARSLGFSERAALEIATSVSELTTNVIKFAGRGKVTVASHRDRMTSRRSPLDGVRRNHL